MKVKSKLADIDFEFGHFEYKKDHLIVHSHKTQSMQSKVYVSPDDIVAAASCAIKNPKVILYLLGFPYFLIRYRKRKRERAQALLKK